MKNMKKIESTKNMNKIEIIRREKNMTNRESGLKDGMKEQKLLSNSRTGSGIVLKEGLMKLLAVLAAIVLMTAIFSACSSGTSDDVSGSGADSSDATAPTAIGEFTTIDLDGNEVTQTVFADAKITMINFWGTYCSPCIQELPELQKINSKYEGDAQIIGVPIDVDFSAKDSAEYKNALKYLEWAEADYLNIQAAGGISEYMQSMQYVPTSIFVDSEGNIIGEAVVGAMTEEYKKRIETYLEQGA